MGHQRYYGIWLSVAVRVSVTSHKRHSHCWFQSDPSQTITQSHHWHYIIAPQAHFVQERAGYLGSRQKLSGGHDHAGLRGDMDEAPSHIEYVLIELCDVIGTLGVFPVRYTA